jgi:[ribosomal protein S5]-alanine N-acetyltransferase
MLMPALETDRLLIRRLTSDDLNAVYRLLDADRDPYLPASDAVKTLELRQHWLAWTMASYDELARLFQPAYGDRAVAFKQTGQVIGLVGYVPCLAPFGQLPSFRLAAEDPTRQFMIPEVGLYYAFDPAHRRRGYATEAAMALVRYAFTALHLRRIVATTAYDNAASIGVMRKLGMRIEHNPDPTPAWFQVVGILENHP